MGTCLIVFFISTIFFMIIWQFLVNKFGKKRCWIYCSLLGIFLFSLFLFCDRGHPLIIILISSLCSIPGSGAYLNDSLMSDIIDYDEFLTHSRNEGIYTVFTTFIPKLVSIFAQSVPMIMLASKLCFI